MRNRIRDWFESDLRRYLLVALVASMLFMVGLLWCVIGHAQTVTLTASPTTGISPLSVTLTWSTAGIPAPATCTASGSWSGAKALSGSTTLTLGGGNYTYSLSCAGTTGSATVNWTAPTQNEDNTPISPTPPGALAGFEIYHATTSAGVPTATPVVINDPAARTYTLTNLPVGNRYYRAKAFNTEGVRSNLSGEVGNLIVAPSASASATVTVNVQPKPPVLVVQVAQVYDMNRWQDGLTKEVGVAQVGVTECYGPAKYQGSFGLTYYEVREFAQTKAVKVLPVAACAAAST